MRLGVVADIHDAVDPLRVALERFRSIGVDKVVTVGDAADTFAPGAPGASVARLLAGARAVGVWGNHDFGLSHEINDAVRAIADPEALAFTASLAGQLVVDEYRFSHLEPWRDACSLADLWGFEGWPDTLAKAHQSFAAVSERVLLVGHFHECFAYDIRMRIEWDGLQPLALRGPDRYLVGLGALRDGWCCVLHGDRAVLEPVWCGEGSAAARCAGSQASAEHR
jgi:predicted phosphodiesterase